MDYQLAGKTVLVTGASLGIGRAVARLFAGEGARVVLSARGQEALGEAVEGIRQSGGEALGIPADVSVADDITRLLAGVREWAGDPEVVVANAGGPTAGPAAEMSDEAWLRGFELTLMSAVRLARAVLPGMRERGWGRIVNITSLSVRAPVENLALSNALRAGVTGFAKTLANEVAGEGITVNAVAPGYTATDRLEELFRDEASRERLVGRIPAGRFGRPEEIAAAVAFLASEQAGYITGQTLLVDGGMVGSLM
ncbi:MAG TPA: SDR family oxidoreductase [Trueperaceae bacterium]